MDALVYGNGRTEALEQMRQAGKKPPRGIQALDDGGWAVPVIFGVDARSKAAAVAFAIDHNNLTSSVATSASPTCSRSGTSPACRRC